MTPRGAEIMRLHNAGGTQRAIAAELGVTYQTVQYHLRRGGVPTVAKGSGAGPSHHSWRGGRFTDRWGYVMVLAPEAGRANKYVAEHCLVAEESIGRRLRRGEVVHHVNGIKTDNRADNLRVCSRAEHKRLHAQLEVITYTLMAEGRITFDGKRYNRA